MDKERELTWKFFWEQKCKEIFYFLKLFFIVIGIVIVIFIGSFILNWAEAHEDTFKIIAIITLISIAIFVLIVGIYFWIESNWIKAKERAKKTLKNKCKEV